jgi:hypothetical protein
MSIVDWLAIGFASLLVVFIALTFTRWMGLFLLSGVARTRGIVPPDSLVDSLAQRLRIKNRVSAVLALIGLVGAAIVLHLTGANQYSDIFIAYAVMGVGFVVGTITVGVDQELRRPQTTVRVARLRVSSLGDYLGPLNRLLSWFVVAATVAFVLIQRSVAESSTSAEAVAAGRGLPATTVIAVITVLGAITFEVAGRAIVKRPQPAGSTSELIADDALRASTLQELLYLPIGFGGYGLVCWVITNHGIRDFTGEPALGGAFFALFVGYVAYALLMRIDRTRYLNRLWPQATWAELNGSSDPDQQSVAPPFASASASPAPAASPRPTPEEAR